MSLKSQPEYAAAATATPAFETMTETAAQTATKEIQMNETKTQQQDAGAMASTAIATASATSVGAHKKLVLAFQDKHGVFDQGTVEGLALAVPRMKGEQGSVFKGDTDLGSMIQIEIVSISPRWAIGTGSKDKESKEKFKVSYDNVTVSGENYTVVSYIESLKAEGYSKAKKTEYLDIFGFVTWTEKTGEVPVEERELCLLQCAPVSRGNFVAFTTTRGLLESRGVVAALDTVEVHAEKKVAGTDKYTSFAFFAPKKR